MLSEKEKFDTLLRLGIELNEVNDLDILMERVLTRARQFVNADAGSIYIREEASLHFSYTQNDTLQQRLPKDEKLIYSTFTIPIDEKSLAGYAATTGKALKLADVYTIDPAKPYHFSRQYDKASGYATKSVLTIPLQTSSGDTIGILQIINAQDENNNVIPFSDEDEKIIFPDYNNHHFRYFNRLWRWIFYPFNRWQVLFRSDFRRS